MNQLLIAILVLTAALCSQDCAEPSNSRILEAVKNRCKRILSIEYLAAFKSGRRSAQGIEDYVCARYKLSKPDHYWSEIYHSDISCVTGLDSERTIRIGDPEGLRTVKPWHRTLRIEAAEMRHIVVSRPDPYLSVLAWWPFHHHVRGPKVGEAPLSIGDALASTEDWQAEATGIQGRYELKSETLRTRFEVDESKGWAVRVREIWRGRMRTRFEVGAFRQCGEFWLPADVSKIAITDGTDARRVLARGELKEVAVNGLSRRDFDTPTIPGLLRIDGDNGQPRFRQVVRGGEDLLAARARRLRHRFADQGHGGWSRYLLAVLAGLVLCRIVRRRAG